MSARGRRLLISAVVCGLLLAGCGDGGEEAEKSPKATDSPAESPTGSPTATGSPAVVGTQLRVNLSGNNEVPRADSGMNGSGTVTLNAEERTACPSLNITTPADAEITGGHIHRGAAGTNGPIVVRFQTDAKSVKSDCVTAEQNVINEIIQNPGGFYVNVHTRRFPDGATRGQLTK